MGRSDILGSGGEDAGRDAIVDDDGAVVILCNNRGADTNALEVIFEEREDNIATYIDM